MHILNNGLKREIKCNKYCAKCIIKHGILPIFSDYNYYYFVFSNEVCEILQQGGLFFKIFARWECYYGK